MITLSTLTNTTRPRKKVQRVGRGVGSGRGKTSCRGHKGDKSRSGYKRRYGKEGGQLPLFRKLPVRGFSNARFAREVVAINLGIIDALYADGETVSIQTLTEKGIISKNEVVSLKILSNGELTKKVQIVAHALSESAKEKLEHLKVPVNIIAFSARKEQMSE